MHVGFLGLGEMGSRMVGCLVAAGHDVTAWNRSPVNPPAGVTLAEDPAAVGRETEQTFVMVGGPGDVDDVVFGSAGWAEGAASGSLLIQTTTIGPTAVTSLQRRLLERDLVLLDAPVGGSTGPAAAGELVILTGGDPADIARVQPLLDAIGSRTVHLGPIGAGSAVKLMVNGVLISALAAAGEIWAWIAEEYPDVKLEQVAGALDRIAPVVAKRMPDLAGDPVSPGFALRHAGKDVGLAVTESGSATVLGAVAEACANAEAYGLGDADLAALGRSARLRRADAVGD